MNEILVFFSLLGGYFLPALIANAREHQNKREIFRVNLLLGWTVVGWLGALIWSLVSKRDNGKAWHE